MDKGKSQDRREAAAVAAAPLNSVEERAEEIVAFLNSLEDWLSVYSYLIDSTFYLEPLDEAERARAHEVEDCQSQTWVLLEERDGLLAMKADSEALIVKGLVGLLVRAIDGAPASEAASARLDFLSRTMLKTELDDVRKAGFASVLRYVASEVRRLAAKSQN